MNQETRNCQNCRKDFTIEPEDFNFYQKIQVPPPTFCPECRLQRRLVFYNLLNLYKRKCDLCQQERISMYAPEAPYKVYCPPCWWSDNWDWADYGRDYDFSRPFFEQWNELLHETPLLGLSLDLKTTESSPWNNHAGDLKNCYLLFDANHNEDSAYGAVAVYNNMVFNCTAVRASELCYDSLRIFKNSRAVGLSNTVESVEAVFLKDSRNCLNCFASAGLRNKQYYIFNKSYSKEDYFKKIKKWDSGSYKTYEELKQRAREHWRKFPPKPRYDEQSVNVTGNYVFESKNCKECYEVIGAEDSKFLLDMSPPIKDCYDVSNWGENIALAYECCVVGTEASNVKFCQEAGLNMINSEYSKLSGFGSRDLFGCVSVTKGKYVILNKRYSEEDYKELVDKIKKHMDELPYISSRHPEQREGSQDFSPAAQNDGIAYRYGEFFPPEMSPHGYNESVADFFFPLTKEEIKKQGYNWREKEKRQYQITKTAADLPDNIKDTPDSILNEVIQCKDCQKGFKLISMELEFLRKMNLPLPRRCPFCRIIEKYKKWIKGLKLVKRTCAKCGAEFDTPYTKEEYGKILCANCYKAEVV